MNQNNSIQRWQPKPLPRLADLHHDLEEAYKNDELNRLLSQPPPSTFVRKHPLLKVKVGTKWEALPYIPIDKVKYLLTRIFGEWSSRIKDVKQVANSVVVTVRLKVRNPISGNWMIQDGVGAAPLQTDSGASAIDASAMKTNAVQIAAPSAESYALKNAAEKFGNLFGAGLGKPDPIEFTGSYQDIQLPTHPPENNLQINTKF